MTAAEFRQELLLEQYAHPTPEYVPTVGERLAAGLRVLILAEVDEDEAAA